MEGEVIRVVAALGGAGIAAAVGVAVYLRLSRQRRRGAERFDEENSQSTVPQAKPQKLPGRQVTAEKEDAKNSHSPPLWQQPRGSGGGSSKGQAWAAGPQSAGRQVPTPGQAQSNTVKPLGKSGKQDSPPAEDSEPIDLVETEDWKLEFQEAAAQLSKEELREFVDGHVKCEIAALKAMPLEQRKNAFKMLCAEWHPDKCPAIAELATEVFQTLQCQRSELLRGD